jgi:hypothetical protein
MGRPGYMSAVERCCFSQRSTSVHTFPASRRHGDPRRVRSADESRRSTVGVGGESFPSFSGQPKWLDAKTFVIPVALKPEHEYQLSFNNDTFRNFISKAGQPAEWHFLRFRGSAARAKAPDPK